MASKYLVASVIAAAALTFSGCAANTGPNPAAVPPPAASPTATLPAPAATPDGEVINNALSGLTVAAAETEASNTGYTFRVISEDGVPKAVTMDYSTARINVEVEDGLVIQATIG